MEITQGDAYNIKIALKDKDGEPITDDLVTSVEVILGGVKKTYPEEVTYSDGYFIYPLKKAESEKLSGFVPFKVRPTFLNGDAVGINLGAVEVNVYDSTGAD